MRPISEQKKMWAGRGPELLRAAREVAADFKPATEEQIMAVLMLEDAIAACEEIKR